MRAEPVAVIRFPPNVSWEFMDAFWALTAKRLPLKGGRATVYVSPEDARFLPRDAVLTSLIDPRLRHLEMRLERRA